MIVRSLAETKPFTTADGSTIRELLGGPQRRRAEPAGARCDKGALGLPTTPVRNQSLAEATLGPGQATERHYHGETEEIYYVVEGAGELELDGERRRVTPGDAILIPPGARHQVRACEAGPLRFLCCCAPAYRHEDTFFD